MNLTIEIPDEIADLLAAQAKVQGISEARYASRVIEKSFAPAAALDPPGQPFETGYRMWAK